MVVRACELTSIWFPVAIVRSPVRVVSALEASGPVFIKLAQWLSTRRDILPEELCDAMGVLHEDVSCTAYASDWKEAEQLVPGLQIGRLLGGGCVAQVFAGELQRSDGPPLDVAVKVRRSGVEQLLATDLRILGLAARLAERARAELRWLALESAVDNFGIYMRQQVDLRIEAENLRRLAANLRAVPRMAVPEVAHEAESVLVTSIAPGVSLSKFIRAQHPDPVRKAVFESLTGVMARMILKDKFIHGDLHPGNVFISLGPGSDGSSSSNSSSSSSTTSATPRILITLIDAGIAIPMTDELMSMALNSMQAAFNKDPEALGDAVVRLHEEEGLCDYAEDLDKLRSGLGYLLMAGCFKVGEDIWGKVYESYEDYRGSRVSEYFTRMINLLSTHKVRVSPSLWSIMTAFALIEGSMLELGYGVSVLRSAQPYLFSTSNVVGWIRSSLQIRNSEIAEGKD